VGSLKSTGLCGKFVINVTSRELVRHNSDLVEVREVRWDRSDTEPAGECTSLYGKGVLITL
jgi:hypothetical protein